MNPGTYLLILVLAAIATAIVTVRYRDLIFDVNDSEPPPLRVRRPARPRDRPPAAERAAAPRVQPAERVQPVERLPNALNAGVQGSGFTVQGSEPPDENTALSNVVMTADELKCLTHAIVLYTQTGVEQPAIEQAFGVKKGASKGWKRAKVLFDAAQPKAYQTTISPDPVTIE